jgi:hypothetical protein
LFCVASARLPLPSSCSLAQKRHRPETHRLVLRLDLRRGLGGGARVVDRRDDADGDVFPSPADGPERRGGPEPGRVYFQKLRRDEESLALVPEHDGCFVRVVHNS